MLYRVIVRIFDAVDVEADSADEAETIGLERVLTNSETAMFDLTATAQKEPDAIRRP
jgi:hypothetical protein